MMRSVTALHQNYSTSQRAFDISHTRAFPSLSQLRPSYAVGLFVSDGLIVPHPSFQVSRNRRPLFLHIRAAKGQKPPPKPASIGIIIGAILLPLGMAGSAVLTGRILAERIKREAMEEAEEWERRFNPSRLLPDGKSEEERQLERESRAIAGGNDAPRTRSRPKREEE